jgi:hypothetical protein
MSVPSNTQGTELLSMQALSTGVMIKGSTITVTGIFSARVWIYVGRTATTALTASPQFMIEGSSASSGDAAWEPLWNSWLTSDPAFDLAAAEAEAVSGTVAAAATSITVASTTNLTVGELIAISNTTSSEIRRILSLVANTSLTVDALANAATGLTLYDGAQKLAVEVDLTKFKRIRFLASGVGIGTSVLVRAVMNTLDSVG